MKKNVRALKGLFIVLFLVAAAALASAVAPQSGAFAVGKGPEGVAFDGANVWVTNQFSNSVTKLRASDGALIGTFAVGKRPVGVVFAGNSASVANLCEDNVMRLQARDGAVIATYAVGDGP